MTAERLISHVSQYEILYNTECLDYRDHSKKNDAWEDISKRMIMPVADCKDIWGKLRNCYTNALKRRRRKMEIPNKKIIPWKYEHQMSFLLPFMESRTMSRRNNMCFSNTQTDNSEDITFIEYEMEPANQSITSSTAPKDISNASGTTKIKSRHRNTQRPNDKFIDDLLNYKMENTGNNRHKTEVNTYLPHEMDEDDLFFLSMSKSLKKLPKVDQANIKMNLHSAIHQVELRQLQYCSMSPSTK